MEWLFFTSECVQLLETMTIDYLLQFTIRIVANQTFMVEYHQFAVLCRIGMPGGEFCYLGITRPGELCPDTAHRICKLQVLGCGLRQVILGPVERIETELQLMSVDGTVIQW